MTGRFSGIRRRCIGGYGWADIEMSGQLENRGCCVHGSEIASYVPSTDVREGNGDTESLGYRWSPGQRQGRPQTFWASLALPTVSALICAQSETHSSQMKTQLS